MIGALTRLLRPSRSQLPGFMSNNFEKVTKFQAVIKCRVWTMATGKMCTKIRTPENVDRWVKYELSENPDFVKVACYCSVLLLLFKLYGWGELYSLYTISLY